MILPPIYNYISNSLKEVYIYLQEKMIMPLVASLIVGIIWIKCSILIRTERYPIVE